MAWPFGQNLVHPYGRLQDYLTVATHTQMKENLVRNEALDRSPKKSQLELIYFFGLVFAVFLLGSSGFDTSEGGYHYSVARQILTEGSLSFAEEQEGIFTKAPNGRTYASHEIGNTLFLIPVAGINLIIEKSLGSKMDQRKLFYLTGFIRSQVAVVYSAIAATLLYALLRMFFLISPVHCALAALAFSFCTFVMAYSRQLFDGVLCMALIAGAMLSLFQFVRSQDIRLFAVGFVLIGLGIITRLSMALILFGFCAYLVVSFYPNWKKLWRLAWIAFAILTPFALWQVYYNHLRTGLWLTSPVQTAQYAANNALNGNLVEGLLGLLFSPGKSIFVYCPLAILTVICLPRFFRIHFREALFVSVVFGAWLILHAKLASWMGAWGWGPRHFITIAPVMCLPACVCWGWLTETVLRRMIVVTCLLWGLVLSVSAVIGNSMFRMMLAYHEGRLDDLVWSMSRNQAIDMVLSAGSNLRNLISGDAGLTIPGLSPANRYASNTLNIWANSAYFQGIPLAALIPIVLAILAFAVFCAIRLRQSVQAAKPTELVSDLPIRA